MAVLYKEGAFSSTEVIKMIACTGSLMELSTFPTVGVGMGINPGTKIRDFYSPFTFFPLCDGYPLKCASSPNRCIDKTLPPSPHPSQGEERQSDTRSLSAWQSRQAQLLQQLPACFVCIRTNVVKFPVGNSYCFPSLWQFSQLLSNIPYKLLFKKRNNFLSCCSSLPPLPLPSFPLPPSMHPLRWSRGTFCLHWL